MNKTQQDESGDMMMQMMGETGMVDEEMKTQTGPVCPIMSQSAAQKGGGGACPFISSSNLD